MAAGVRLVAVWRAILSRSEALVRSPALAYARRVIAGLDDPEILHEALIRPLNARVPYPGSVVVDRPEWFQLFTPAFRDGGMNEVSRVQLADDRADAAIDQILGQYAAQGIRFHWKITPFCRPRDLAERLARRGMIACRCIVMAADVDELQLRPVPDVTVERVDETLVDVFADVSARGWNTAAAPLADLQRRMLTDPEGRHHSFLARVDGEPAGAASDVQLERSAYFMGGVVLPAFRGRGVYRALLAARLAHAAAAGVRLVTTQAMADTSAPILARLGFHTVATIDVFTNR